MEEPKPGELHSRHIVAQMDEGLKVRAGRFKTLHGIEPQLTILCDNEDYEPSMRYLRLKQKIGAKLGIAVKTVVVPETLALIEHIQAANEDPTNHGTITQFPLRTMEFDKLVVSLIDPRKDVDGMTSQSWFEPATPKAGFTLLDGYSIDYLTEPTAVVGDGFLVGGPTKRILEARRARNLMSFNIDSDRLDVVAGLNRAFVIITAMGQPGLLTPDLFEDITKPHVIVDAGAAERDGVLRGDVSPELRELGMQNGWLITPEIGGIGPITVRTLLANTVTAAELQLAA